MPQRPIATPIATSNFLHHVADLIPSSPFPRRLDKYEAYKARVRAAKPSEREATEKKELEAVEREGLVAERLAERGYGKAMMGVPKGKLE